LAIVDEAVPDAACVRKFLKNLYVERLAELLAEIAQDAQRSMHAAKSRSAREKARQRGLDKIEEAMFHARAIPGANQKAQGVKRQLAR